MKKINENSKREQTRVIDESTYVIKPSSAKEAIGLFFHAIWEVKCVSRYDSKQYHTELIHHDIDTNLYIITIYDTSRKTHSDASYMSLESAMIACTSAWLV